jgi:beta-xylosidase
MTSQNLLRRSLTILMAASLAAATCWAAKPKPAKASAATVPSPAVTAASSASTLVAPPPAIPGLNADPTLIVFGGKYYLYPTADGTAGWLSTNFSCWSSPDLVRWKNEGVILDLPRDLTWAKARAWAPTIIDKDGKYYFYYAADANISVAISDKPTGPFKDPLGRPMIRKGAFKGQMIDPMAFRDDDGSTWFYFGQRNCYAVKLDDSLTSFSTAKVRRVTPRGYNEGSFVFKRKGVYYLTWSEHDTRSPLYCVAYAMGKSPLGPFVNPPNNVILRQKGPVLGPGHHSVIQLPGTDKWVIAYHRFAIPGGGGYKRETCLSPMRFGADGHVLPVDPLEPVAAAPLAK